MKKENVKRNLKYARVLTLTLSILTFVSSSMWLLWSLIIGLTRREEDWYNWGLSTASSYEAALWQSHALFDVFTIFPLLLSFALFLSMLAFYLKITEKGSIPTVIPYYIILLFQMGSLYAVKLMRLFTTFGLYWSIVNVTIFVLAILAIHNIVKMRQTPNEPS